MGRGKPFEPGNTSGKGRPPGVCNKKTIFQEALEKDGEKIISENQASGVEGGPDGHAVMHGAVGAFGKGAEYTIPAAYGRDGGEFDRGDLGQ